MLTLSLLSQLREKYIITGCYSVAVLGPKYRMRCDLLQSVPYLTEAFGPIWTDARSRSTDCNPDLNIKTENVSWSLRFPNYCLPLPKMRKYYKIRILQIYIRKGQHQINSLKSNPTEADTFVRFYFCHWWYFLNRQREKTLNGKTATYLIKWNKNNTTKDILWEIYLTSQSVNFLSIRWK